MRNMQIIVLLNLAALFSACSGAKLTDDIKARSTPGQANSETDYATSPDAVVTQPDANASMPTPPVILTPQPIPVADVPAVPAIVPTIVSGASLTCSLKADNTAQCLATLPQGEAFDFPAVRAFVVQGSPAKWKLTSLVKLGPGIWSVNVNGSSGSFAIAVQDAQNATLVDWILDPTQPPPNLVNDGSFESLIDPSKPTAAFQFIASTPSLSWQARFATGFTGCQLPHLEVQLAHTSVLPAEGSRFIELNSACKDNPFDGPSPIAVSQTVGRLVKGNYYELRIDYRSRPDFAPAVGFQVTFGSQLLPPVVVSQPAWREFRTVLKADSEQALLSIEETTRHSIGIGALIDNVRIFDLGTGKE